MTADSKFHNALKLTRLDRMLLWIEDYQRDRKTPIGFFGLAGLLRDVVRHC